MEFRTELNVEPSSVKIGLQDTILTIGSCFSEMMGARFLENKFHVIANPFGTCYHPLAIHKLINYSAFQEYPQLHTYLVNQESHLNYDFHSHFHADDRSKLQEKINSAIAALHFFLKQCNVVMITYGTAWVYEREDTGEAVANCHKMPAKLFTKKLSTQSEIQDSFHMMLKNLRSINPKVRVILTLSPVRHVKDTLELNAVSKSVLRLACHEIASENSSVDYFPSYEIMMDDLRDYRFYKDDLIHPTVAAETYIWEKFSAAYFSSDTSAFIDRLTQIRKSLAHKAFNAASPSHKRFLIDLLFQLEDLGQHANLKEEIDNVRSQIAVET